MTGSKPVVTPSIKVTPEELDSEKELQPHSHTAYRAAAARANYLAADRIDIQFSAKEICRWMSKPTTSSLAALKRLVRYLRGAPRLVFRYRRQKVEYVDVYSDTDWAGCPSTQPSVSLSSGEAEFSGVVKGAGMGLGLSLIHI